MAYPDGYFVNTQDPRRMGGEQLVEYALAARDRAVMLEGVLLSKHGGEPLALLDELDASRVRVSTLEDMLRGVADKLRSEANGDGGLASRIDYLLRPDDTNSSKKSAVSP